MVRLLNMKKKLNFLSPIEDPCRVIIKRFKEKRTKILKQSLHKLKKIPDAEQCLRQAVLIRNTFIRAKDLSPRQFERQLLTQPEDQMDQTHSELLEDLTDSLNNNISESDSTSIINDLNDIAQALDCNTEVSHSQDSLQDSRQMISVLWWSISNGLRTSIHDFCQTIWTVIITECLWTGIIKSMPVSNLKELGIARV